MLPLGLKPNDHENTYHSYFYSLWKPCFLSNQMNKTELKKTTEKAMKKEVKKTPSSSINAQEERKRPGTKTSTTPAERKRPGTSTTKPEATERKRPGTSTTKSTGTKKGGGL